MKQAFPATGRENPQLSVEIELVAKRKAETTGEPSG
jgi:hypothetical protein